MAINVVIPLLIPLEENLLNATRLLSRPAVADLGFTEPRYCSVLAEDAQPSDVVTTVTATHSDGEDIRYSIIGGNRDGLFTIDQHTGTITLAAPLDYEKSNKHELFVVAESAGKEAHAIVKIIVLDVNDNAPFFVNPNPEVIVIEEDDRDLPKPLIKVEARDRDRTDQHGLLYTVRGDGVDGYARTRAYFAINSQTGELLLLRALDRDLPYGKSVWKVRVQVRDGQALWSRHGTVITTSPSSGSQTHQPFPRANQRRVA
ncbi:neural-cadherin-like [Penaeus monodon]|uniref:neural-cadherin-like n=1 Tax=Penaeus monodon TaxID=6687 RepID=UPI0018A6FBF8|nr:neural-cadherin-like [Penaeus monodon]